VIAGYTGTQQRATYTCVGTAVNLAARLEAHTKTVHRPILIDGDTRAAVATLFNIEPLGPTRLNGMSQPVEVFCLDRAPRSA